jgi:hypothetical protein
MYVAHTNFTPPCFASLYQGKKKHQRAIQGYSASVKHNDSEGQDSVHFQGKANQVDPEYIELDTPRWAALTEPKNQLIQTFISWTRLQSSRPDEVKFQEDWKSHNTSKAFRLLNCSDVKLSDGDDDPRMSMPERLLDHDQNFEWLTQQIGDQHGAWAFIQDVLVLFYEAQKKSGDLPTTASNVSAYQAARMRIMAHKRKFTPRMSASQTSLPHASSSTPGRLKQPKQAPAIAPSPSSATQFTTPRSKPLIPEDHRTHTHNRKTKTNSTTKRVSIELPKPDNRTFWPFPWPRPKRSASNYEMTNWGSKTK